MGHAGPGLGQQNLDLLEVGSVSGGYHQLSAGLGHQMLYLVNGFLGWFILTKNYTDEAVKAFSLPGSRGHPEILPLQGLCNHFLI